MKNLFLIIALGLMAMSLTLSAEAKTLLKRVDVDYVPTKAVAMALETYDGDFYDLAEFAQQKKYKGNIDQIKNASTLKLKSGEEIDVNGIRYFFIAKKNRPSMKLPPPEKMHPAFKMPSDEN